MVSNHSRGWLRTFGILVCAIIVAGGAAAVPSGIAMAQANPKNADETFNIQVSPATLTVTLKPGEQKTVPIIIRNLSNHSETLTPRLSGFSISNKSDKIELDNRPPANMAAWVSFKQGTLALGAGESKTLDVVYNTPGNVGFSYSSAVTLSRTNTALPIPTSGAGLRGTVAIFNLVNIDRPDAKRELAIDSFHADKGSYEFLPANFALTIKNGGNVIDRPSGNIFIQRSLDDTIPIATIPLNTTGGYILPGNTRAMNSEWNEGFPRYTANDNGQSKLVWNWKELNDLRFGKYVAKAVLVYNDGQRDIPVMASVSFWVIPWRIIIALFVVIIVLAMGLFGWGRIIAAGTKKVRHYAVRKR